MRKSFASASLLLAWLCAQGALWDVAQVVAWTRMYLDYSETLSVGAALQATFDPAKRCDLCVTVAEAKETAREQAAGVPERTSERVVLALTPTATPVFRGPSSRWPAAPPLIGPERGERVPVPPPRA